MGNHWRIRSHICIIILLINALWFCRVDTNPDVITLQTYIKKKKKRKTLRVRCTLGCVSELSGNRVFVDLLMLQQDKRGSTDTFTDAVVLRLPSASLVPSDLQVTHSSIAGKKERGKQAGGLFAQQHWARSMLQLHSTSVPRCLLLSPGGERSRVMK